MQAERWEQAERVWEEAEGLIYVISDNESKAEVQEVLTELATVLMQAERWEQAKRVTYAISNDENKAPDHTAIHIYCTCSIIYTCSIGHLFLVKGRKNY